MPVFTSGTGLAPPWCELEYFNIRVVPQGGNHTYMRLGRKEKLIVGRGQCRVAIGDRTVDAGEGANLDLPDDKGGFHVVEAMTDCTLVRMCGRWGDEVGGSGIFTVADSDSPSDAGDPVDYPKRTCLDNHYHDCDEYWILFEGRGTVVSEGKSYEVGPGDCVATGMGHHHDLPIVVEPVRAVYFETTMEGAQRPGHLWAHTHGPAQPLPDRI